VFISSTDEGNTLPVFEGQSWITAAMAINTVSVQASTDGTNWTPMAAVAGSTGRYSINGLSLAQGATGKVYAKLSINGNVYTSNGAVYDGVANINTKVIPIVIPNAIQVFNVTPH
jgi:hypothetical protein